ncbi:chemotaxis protein MotB [Tamilnaduibacter salinus]|uniref:Chemotaxis protein MotB n=1 Tax=Tamilnaduibacter salinus TaxID=1484056 RepID=A0A2U1CY73_9GAMM|nr:flagellar motor protein MotB [Tamilnaduibacter salinus]PVY77444.1 chemotaxis protein MotB [Tamilnaduibacter salinus]
MAIAGLRRARPKTGGAPGWIVTFADLATLLLTFFVLLLSYSEMDAEKYRSMAASLASAFGSSVIEGGGPPVVVIETPAPTGVPTQPDAQRQPTDPGPELIDDRPGASPEVTPIAEGITELASRLIRELEPQVASDDLSVSYDTEQVVIRFSEDATFPSGSADLKPAMQPVIDRIVGVLSRCSGEVVVSGHTDDRPITSSRYRSNWDLSAARAVSVVHELVMNRAIEADRVMAAGRAETNPLVPNTSPANRARNRRVEIAIRNPECQPSGSGEDPAVNILP